MFPPTPQVLNRYCWRHERRSGKAHWRLTTWSSQGHMFISSWLEQSNKHPRRLAHTYRASTSKNRQRRHGMNSCPRQSSYPRQSGSPELHHYIVSNTTLRFRITHRLVTGQARCPRNNITPTPPLKMLSLCVIPAKKTLPVWVCNTEAGIVERGSGEKPFRYASF